LILLLSSIILMRRQGNSWFLSVFSILFSTTTLILIELLLIQFPRIHAVINNSNQTNFISLFALLLLTTMLSYSILSLIAFISRRIKPLLKKIIASLYFTISCIFFAAGLVFSIFIVC
jgi:hypothetical protein